MRRREREGRIIEGKNREKGKIREGGGNEGECVRNVELTDGSQMS